MATPAVTTTRLPIATELPEARRETRSLAFSLARRGLMAVLLAAPLAFGAVEPWAWAALLSASFVLLTLWTIGSARQGELKVRLSPLYLPAGLFLALAVAQLCAGATLDAYATRESILKLVMALVIFFVAGQVFARAPGNAWKELGLFVTLYAFALGLFAILQFFSGHNLIYWSVRSPGWTFGPYVNHNDYAGLMEMLVPVAAGYALSRPRPDHRRALLAFALPLPVASALLSGSRGGFVSLLVEALVFGWILWRRSGGSGSRVRAMLPMGLAAAALLFFWMAPNRVVRRLEALATATRATRITLEQRELAARDTLRIFRDYPWLGIGLGSFNTAFSQYRSFPTDLGWAHAHNDYAEALAETGLAGGALIALALAMFFGLTFRDLPAGRRDAAGWIRLGAAVGCCGLLVHSLVDFNLHIPANALWFAVCVALATAGRQERRDISVM